MEQSPLTVILNIKPEQKQALEDLLNGIGQDIRRNPYLRFPEIETTHFARFVMIGGGDLVDRDVQTRLYFSSNFDGNWEDYLDLLVTKAGSGVEAIFSKCQDYPNLPLSDPAFKAKFKNYIRANTLPTTTFYQGYPKRSVQEVKAAIALRQRLQELLNTPQADEVLEELVRQFPPLPDQRKTFKGRIQGILEDIRKKLLQQVLNLLQTLLGPKIATDPPPNVSLAVNTRPDVTDWLYTVQNEMTVVTTVDAKRLRNLGIFLGIVNFLSKTVFTHGELAGLTTIHFARWVIIDGGKNLLFESNYDGNWEQYIGDFVDKASGGMDSIWGNCVGYPVRGSKDLQAFKQIIIDHQVRAQVFYSAYPQQSVRNVLNDIKISEKLGQLLQQPALAEWLGRL